MSLVDTSVLIDHLRGHPPATDSLEQLVDHDDGACTSEVSRFEVLAGMRPHEADDTEACSRSSRCSRSPKRSAGSQPTSRDGFNPAIRGQGRRLSHRRHGHRARPVSGHLQRPARSDGGRPPSPVLARTAPPRCVGHRLQVGRLRWHGRPVYTLITDNPATPATGSKSSSRSSSCV